MFLHNFDVIKRLYIALPFEKNMTNFTIKDVTGNIVNPYRTFINPENFMKTTCFGEYSNGYTNNATKVSIRQTGTYYNNILIGTSNTPVQSTDYCLNIPDSLEYFGTPTNDEYIDSNNIIHRTIYSSFINKGDSEVTVTEWGLKNHLQTSSSPYVRIAFLIFRELFDSPILLAPNDVFSFLADFAIGSTTV